MRLPWPPLLLGFPWESSSHTESEALGIKAQLSACRKSGSWEAGGLLGGSDQAGRLYKVI